uniref:Uncharacterized protein n=1 Tax=Malurus cyaneus samueli TaxID=2593467 RepID=A0A8C5TD15_9PASS
VPPEPALSTFQPSPHYTPDPVQLCFNQGLVRFGTKGVPRGEKVGEGVAPWGGAAAMWEFGGFQELGMLVGLSPFPQGAPNSLGEQWPWHGQCPLPSPSCCCPACGAQRGDSHCPQSFPCPGTDCPELLPALPVPEDFFRRDRSWDICYS